MFCGLETSKNILTSHERAGTQACGADAPVFFRHADYKHFVETLIYRKYNKQEVSAMLSVADIKVAVEPIVKNTKVEKMILFGSYAKGNATTDSDIDLCLISNGNITGLAFFELKSKIENAFEQVVELFPDLDIIPNSPVARHINESGVVIYERQG